MAETGIKIFKEWRNPITKAVNIKINKISHPLSHLRSFHAIEALLSSYGPVPYMSFWTPK